MCQEKNNILRLNSGPVRELLAACRVLGREIEMRGERSQAKTWPQRVSG
jgi:predicted enzyme involved in methoxymalonyl-ACP biosynthesis